MDTTNVNGWWTCSGCGVEAEFGAELAGASESCVQPCPDCGDAMQQWMAWEVAAA